VFRVLAGRKYRLEFDFGQRVFADRLGGICRAVWNTALEQRRNYRRRGAWISYEEQCRHGNRFVARRGPGGANGARRPTD
jgi:putative transposase